LIEAVGLTKRYRPEDAPAVAGLDLSIPAGELFGFLGPNGAGKTTTIKMLVGLLMPTAGHARIAGFDIVREPAEAKRRVGYVPDNPYVYEKLTGREFLDFVADLYSLPGGAARHDKSEALLARLDLTEQGDRLIGGYSRGMRQKITLAAALLHDPRALILDEPTVGLDPGSTRKLKDILRTICRESKVAVFLSTHTLEVAAEICDRIGIFHKGVLIALGSPAAVSAQAPSGKLEDVFLDLTAPDKVCPAPLEGRSQ
jgi:ABC-2 type transport system ATP-binding protein